MLHNTQCERELSISVLVLTFSPIIRFHFVYSYSLLPHKKLRVFRLRENKLHSSKKSWISPQVNMLSKAKTLNQCLSIPWDASPSGPERVKPPLHQVKLEPLRQTRNVIACGFQTGSSNWLCSGNNLGGFREIIGTRCRINFLFLRRVDRDYIESQRTAPQSQSDPLGRLVRKR